MNERAKEKTQNPNQSVSHRLDTQSIRLQRNKFGLSIFSIDFYVVIQQSITGNTDNSSINSVTPIFAVNARAKTMAAPLAAHTPHFNGK